jgi:hypothetical protein
MNEERFTKGLNESGGFSYVGTVKNVTFKRVPATITSMAFFDRLTDAENEICRSHGEIVGCFDEYTEFFILCSELQKLIAMPESEHYDLFAEAEREEFLFKLFGHFSLGGSLCQHEVEIEPYLNVTKDVYKDLVT